MCLLTSTSNVPGMVGFEGMSLNKNQRTESTGKRLAMFFFLLLGIHAFISFLGTLEFKYKFYHKTLL